MIHALCMNCRTPVGVLDGVRVEDEKYVTVAVIRTFHITSHEAWAQDLYFLKFVPKPND